MFQLLLIDDDPQINKLTRKYLEKAGFTITSVFDYQSAIREAEDGLFDLAIVDIMLPDGNGLDLVRTFRQELDLPVIMMTARADIHDKAIAYQSGADDYLVKPFDPNELVLRVQAVLKRVTAASSTIKDPLLSHEEIVIGQPETSQLRIIYDTQTVLLNNESVPIPKREFQLLSLLAENKNRTLTREQIVDHLWGIDFEGELRVVDLYIDRLRKRLRFSQSKSDSFSIRTVRGLGYRLEVLS